MKSVQVFSLLCLLGLAACQKELSVETGNIPGGDSTLLVKIVVTNQQNDSTVMAYSYDGNKRVIGTAYSGKDSNNNEYNQQLQIKRDNNGRITQVAGSVRLATLLPEGIPAGTLPVSRDGEVQTTKNVHYPDASTRNFDYVTSIFQMGAITATDSTVYTYSNNTVIKAVSYLSAALVPGLPSFNFLADSTVYAYDGQGNLTSSNSYGPSDLSSPGSTLVLGITNTYEYGTQPNPLVLGNEAFLFDQETRCSANVLLKQTVAGDFDPGTKAYSALTFNTHQLMLTADLTETDADGTRTYKVKCYYK